MRGRRALGALLIGTVLGVLGAGCVSVPQDGPVVDVASANATDDAQASARDASPPEAGAGTVEIVDGFLDAMQSWPVDISVARQYLDEEAATSWNPDAATVTYTDNFPPQDRGSVVTVQLSGAERIDGRGAWQGPLRASAQTVRFDLVLEDGEYRIADPPNALMVPTSWFAQRYRQVSLYFFDPTGRILVPEPVFVPRGRQLVSTLVERLLAGPEPAPGGLTRTYLPPGLTAGLSVTVSEDGVADLALSGGDVPQSPDAVERMLAQLAWTLRQEPSVQAIRVSVGGVAVPLPDGGQEYDVDDARQFDPSGYPVDGALWGLTDGRLVTGGDDGFTATPGPWGEQVPGVRSVAVDLDGTTAAGVSTDGTTLLTAPVGDGPKRLAVTTSVISDGTDLLPPAWDFSGRLWTVDRTAGGARVRYVEDGRVRDVTVPGVTGQDVRAFLVSRDATRFVAVVRRGLSDVVRAGRIVVDGRSQVDRVTPATAILGDARDRALSGVQPARIRDIGWTSPTTLAVLGEVVRNSVYEVRAVPVDGAPTTGDSALATTLSGSVRRLAVSPEPEATQYAVVGDGLIDLASGATVPLRSPVASLGYVG